MENLGGLDLSSYKTSTNSYGYIDDAANTTINNLNSYMQRVAGAASFGINTSFCSSSEFSSLYACYVGFRDGYLGLKWSYKDGDFGVCPVLAF